MNDQKIDQQANGANGRKIARRAVALVLALVIAGLLYVGIGLAYAVPDEYGMFTSGDTMADIARHALIMGSVLGLVAAGLLSVVLRLLDRRHPRPLVLAAVVLVTAAATGAAGVVGRHNHDAGVVRASTACTPTRMAIFTEIAPPFQTVSAPFGERGGSCTDVFVLRGGATGAGAVFDGQLRDLGWTEADSEKAPTAGTTPSRHFVRRGADLVVRDDGDMSEMGYTMIRATLG